LAFNSPNQASIALLLRFLLRGWQRSTTLATTVVAEPPGGLPASV
jgi:hypothetical protein